MNTRIGKPLSPYDLPEALREALDYTSYLMIPHITLRTKQLLTVERVCLGCKQRLRVAVNKIRWALKRGAFTGRCLTCALAHTAKQRAGPLSNSWKGGRRYHEGYILAYAPEHPNTVQNGYVLEHRLVMEKAVGRHLMRSETVHHKNGIRDDNRLENLELWHSEHPSGQRLSDKPHCPTCTCEYV